MESCNCFQPISRLHISGKCMASFFFGVICWTHRNPFFIHPQWMEGEICFPRKFVDVLTLDDIIVARLHMNGCFTDSLMHFIFIAVVTWIECTISVGMLVVLARLHIEWSSCHLFCSTDTECWCSFLMHMQFAKSGQTQQPGNAIMITSTITVVLFSTLVCWLGLKRCCCVTLGGALSS